MTLPVSVVIPTFRRLATLPGVLEALGRQTLSAESFEVVVVDDGSGDATAGFLSSFRPRYRFRALSQGNTGPAGARNRGVEAAQGDLVVFLGDDTFPEERFLAEHVRAHAERPGRRISALGYTTWPADRRVTPFLDQINEYGLQFGYSLIEDRENVPFNFFYTSNISLPRATLLEAGLFDTTFPHAAWEDIELAYRLSQTGYTIVYVPSAVARHHHDITLASFRRRQRRAGEAAAIFFRKHPELGGFLGVEAARRGGDSPGPLTRLLARASQRLELPGARRALERVLRADYLAGLRAALEDG